MFNFAQANILVNLYIFAVAVVVGFEGARITGYANLNILLLTIAAAEMVVGDTSVLGVGAWALR
ncbi:hypothetical protein [Nitrosovibrio sp. Nv6]|uniref:hypothetical protein n=1 Tax=Nitrosovibrio sp. Nv6 TaxID=1855340 RepID=UPI0008BDD320|nr:hypothetical protein [Nitrosovibrio sp. Nv6]SEO58149.1 hypothetical protein SAMN05216316_0539 [Nitrosovibrio sp. Nv6]